MSAWDNNNAMEAALPGESQANGSRASGTAVMHREVPTGNWGQKTQNNYDEDNQDISWEGNARVYEWDGEEGDIGPEHPQLEFDLFGDPGTRDPQGIDFRK